MQAAVATDRRQAEPRPSVPLGAPSPPATPSALYARAWGREVSAPRHGSVRLWHPGRPSRRSARFPRPSPPGWLAPSTRAGYTDPTQRPRSRPSHVVVRSPGHLLPGLQFPDEAILVMEQLAVRWDGGAP